MIEVGAYKDQKVGVFGLARSGLAACRALTDGGAKVLAWDDAETARAAALETPVDLYQENFEALAALIVSPGVPLTFPEPHPLVKKAQTTGVPVLGDMELFANHPGCRLWRAGGLLRRYHRRRSRLSLV